MSGRIYHLALADEWAAALAAGRYERSTRDASLADVGFIHCSYDHQVQGTADRYYVGADAVVLLHIDPARVEADVRADVVDDVGTTFPHVYGPLAVEAVVAAVPLSRGADGRLRVGAALVAGSRPMDAPQLTPLFHAHFDLQPPVMATTALGTHITVLLDGGRFEGERLSGHVVGGGDWLVIDDEGTWYPDVHNVLAIDGGPAVRMDYRGRIVLPDGGMDRLLGGETIEATELYYRVIATFATEPGPYGWLNKTLAVGVGTLNAAWVEYDFFEIT